MANGDNSGKGVLRGLMRFGSGDRNAKKGQADDARALHASLLPESVPQVAGYDVSCEWKPSDAVSGDYFDVFPLEGDRIALCVADVSGKGMAAAMLASEVQSAVRTHAPQSASPSELCTSVNRTLSGKIAPGAYASMFYGVLDAGTGRLHYENAGHCLPVLIRGDGNVEFPASFSGVLGLFSHWLYQNQELELRTGDTLLLVTDGVIEAESKRGEEFGYQRLITMAQSGQHEDAHSLGQGILAEVGKFCKDHFEDDASLIVLRVD